MHIDSQLRLAALMKTDKLNCHSVTRPACAMYVEARLLIWVANHWLLLV